MNGDSANTEKTTNKNKKYELNNVQNPSHDIRSFFNKQSGPSVLTTNRRIIKVIEPYINDIDENNYKLRERKIVNYKHRFELSDSSSEDLGQKKKNKLKNKNFKDFSNDEENKNLGEDEIEENLSISSFNNIENNNKNITRNLKLKNKLKSKKKNTKGKLNKKIKKQKTEEVDENGFIIDESDNASNISNYDLEGSDVDYIELRGTKHFTKFKHEALKTINDAEFEMKKLLKDFYINEAKIGETKSKYPELCVPIQADIRQFKFKNLADKQMEITGQLFDVIMMDPPWQLSSSQPTRGVAIAYDTLNDNIITDIPVEKLQTDGFIFIWTINAKFKVTLDLIKQWGYRYCDEIVWIKQTVNGKIAKGHGYYLQHTKETCLIGIKGNPVYSKSVFGDVIFSKRRGQSQKPEETYDIIERLVPNGYYLEIFGRRNNLRNNWVTIGNEI